MRRGAVCLCLVFCLVACRPGASPQGVEEPLQLTAEVEPVQSLSTIPSATSLPAIFPETPVVAKEGADMSQALTPTPSVVPTPIARQRPTSMPLAGSPITLTILYDNQVGAPRLTNKWGFACLVETSDTTLLFDTGGDAPTLLSNASLLGKDLSSVAHVVLSHLHGDHTGGLQGLLTTGISPTVYMLSSFPYSMRQAAAARTTLMEIDAPQLLLPGIWTTGGVSGLVDEQALVVETNEGWIVITGCAHPGVEAMVARAVEITEGDIALVIGGFHLGSASPQRIAETIAALKSLDVEAVAPTHCTGDRALAAFAEAYGDAFNAAGAGVSWAFERPHYAENRVLNPQ